MLDVIVKHWFIRLEPSMKQSFSTFNFTAWSISQLIMKMRYYFTSLKGLISDHRRSVPK